MSNFILNSNDDERKIIEFKKKECYYFSPKTKKGSFTSLKSVSVYDSKRVQKIIINRYKVKYQRLMKIINNIINSDDTTEGDFMICLDEIKRLQSVLTIKYEKLLSRKAYEYFIEDLYFLEKVVKDKLYEYKNQESLNGGMKR